MRNIDEINNIRSEKPKDYFAVMELTPEQLKKRLEYTEKAFPIFDLILILILTMRDYETIDVDYIKTTLIDRLTTLFLDFTTPDDYLIDYAINTAENFVDTTIEHQDDEYYTSEDRALFNAENSANDVANYVEYQEAIEKGKTHKMWISKADVKVRKTHQLVSSKKIPIDKLFEVGKAKMRFPKDYEAGEHPEETVNCRCTVKYLPEDKEV